MHHDPDRSWIWIRITPKKCNLNPGLALTGFWNTWPWSQQINLTVAREPIEKQYFKKLKTSTSSKLEPAI